MKRSPMILCSAALLCLACEHGERPSSSPDAPAPETSTANTDTTAKANFDTSLPATDELIVDVASASLDPIGDDASEVEAEIDTVNLSPSQTAFDDRHAAEARAEADQARIEDRLDAELVHRVVRTQLDDIRSCYAAGLIDHPELGGRLVVAFAIDHSGEVTSSWAQRGFPDARVGACVAKAVRDWTFPPLTAGEVEVEVEYSLQTPPTLTALSPGSRRPSDRR